MPWQFISWYSQMTALHQLSGLSLHVHSMAKTLTSLAASHSYMKISFICSTISPLAVAESTLVLVHLSHPFVHRNVLHPTSQDTARKPHFLHLNHHIWTHHCFLWSFARNTKDSGLGCYWHR